MKKLSATIVCLGLAALSLKTAFALSSSMNLTESDTAYTVKIGVSEKTPVNMRLAGRQLMLETSADAANAPRYQQILQLPDAVPDAPLGIQRDSEALVITIPKKGQATSAATAPDPFQAAFAGLDNTDAMRDDMLKQAKAMMSQLGQAAKSSGGGSNGIDMIQALINQSGLAGVVGGGAGVFDFREEADRYILSAAISKSQSKNVSVNVNNERFVTITTKQEKNSQAGPLSAFSASSSTQSLTLPGPVKSDQMTMEYKNGRLEVTLPKA